MKRILSIFFIVNIILFCFGLGLSANNNVHAWYYIWYQYPNYQSHWSTQGCGETGGTIAEEYFDIENISSNFFPVKGSYSSLDPYYSDINKSVIHQHAREMRRAGIEVAIISIWRHHMTSNGILMIKKVMETFNSYGIKSTFALEPYLVDYNFGPSGPIGDPIDIGFGDGFYSIHDEDEVTVRYFPNAINELWSAFSEQDHCWDKYNHNGVSKRIIYVWSSSDNMIYRKLTESNIQAWRNALYNLELNNDVKNKFFIFDHAIDNSRLTYLGDDVGFKGQYNYDGTIEVSQVYIDDAKDTIADGYIVSGGISPGYDDRRAVSVPKGSISREGGGRLGFQFNQWDKVPVSIVSVVTFNEWHEGTQIEPARYTNPGIPTNCGPDLDFYKTYGGWIEQGEERNGIKAEGMYLDILRNKIFGNFYNLSIAQPNGSETWAVDNTYQIGWNRSGGIDSVGGKAILELVDSNGNSFDPEIIIYDGSNSGGFNWTIPNSIPTGDYKIKIQSQYFRDIFDESDQTFHINNPSGGSSDPFITVSSPASSSIWIPGSTNTIIWSLYGDQNANVKIELFNSGNLDSTISISTANDGGFSWAIPVGQTEGAGYQVRITTLDGLVTDDSNMFTIVIDPNATPTIIVTSPTTGVSWNTGETYNIIWDRAGVMSDNVKVNIFKNSIDVPNFVEQLVGPNTGTISWTIPDTYLTGNYAIRVKTDDSLVHGDSNLFGVVNSSSTTASITVTSPVLNNKWNTSSTYKIAWDKTGTLSDNIEIEVYKNSIDTLNLIEQLTGSNSGQYLWTIPNSYATGDYLFRIKTDDNMVSNDSDIFQIRNITTHSYMLFKSPSYCSTWYKNNTYSIGWGSTGTISDNIKINIFKDSTDTANFIEQLTGSNTGSLVWTIPDTYVTGNYVLRIKTDDNLVVGDSSLFSISDNPVTQPSITVVSPAQCSTWYKNSTHTITWDRAGTMSDNVKVNIFKDTIDEANFVKQLTGPNTGSITWTIPDTYLTGNYALRVKTDDSLVVGDSEVFSISTSSTSAPYIIATSPVSCDTFEKSKTYTITWIKSGSMSDTVKINIFKNSIDVPNFVMQVVSSNNGTAKWTVPCSFTNGNYILRIKTDDNLVLGDSDVFVISD